MEKEILITDIINRLKSVSRFDLHHYREGAFSIDTERSYDGNGDYIDSYEIDNIIRHLEEVKMTNSIKI